MRPLSCDPNRIRGMSERMIISHYENNYGGAVKRLNLIDERLAELDYTSAPGFLVNGLKREQLIATNSMILHEVFFDSLGDESEPEASQGRAAARLWFVRSLASRVQCYRQGARRRFRLGAADLVAAGLKAHQPVGVGSLPHRGWRYTNSGARYVRAFLSHRLRRQGCQLCRCVYGCKSIGRQCNALMSGC